MTPLHPISTAPRTGTRFRALSGRTDHGQIFRYDATTGTFLQYVKHIDQATHKDIGGTWHRPFFTPKGWRPC